MTEEWPRLAQLKASCCDVNIARFDLPSRVQQMLRDDAVRHAWIEATPDQWQCPDHRQDAFRDGIRYVGGALRALAIQGEPISEDTGVTVTAEQMGFIADLIDPRG